MNVAVCHRFHQSCGVKQACLCVRRVETLLASRLVAPELLTNERHSYGPSGNTRGYKERHKCDRT